MSGPAASPLAPPQDPTDVPTLRAVLTAGCHLMRNRFTVVDLLDLLGRWTEADREAVLDAATAAVTTARDGAGAAS